MHSMFRYVLKKRLTQNRKAVLSLIHLLRQYQIWTKHISQLRRGIFIQISSYAKYAVESIILILEFSKRNLYQATF